MDELVKNLKMLQVFKDLVDGAFEIPRELLDRIESSSAACIETIKQHDLIKYIINTGQGQTEITGQIESISSLLGGADQEVDVKDFNPVVFDSIGQGLSSLFKVEQGPPQQSSLQQKSEIKNTNSNNNLTYQIKKK